MNAVSLLHASRFLCPSLLALGIAGASLLAQPVNQSQAAVAASASAASYEAALAAFVSRDTAGAERALFQSNTSRPGSIDWNIECASRLIHIAFVLRERADFATGNAVAARALDYVNEAKLNGFASVKAVRRAQVHEIAGFIHERLMVDPASAKAAFLAAQRELPSSKAAQAGLDRIKNQEDLAGRLPGGKG